MLPLDGRSVRDSCRRNFGVLRGSWHGVETTDGFLAGLAKPEPELTPKRTTGCASDRYVCPPLETGGPSTLKLSSRRDLWLVHTLRGDLEGGEVAPPRGRGRLRLQKMGDGFAKGVEVKTAGTEWAITPTWLKRRRPARG